MPETGTVALYARVSTSEQDPERQLRALRDHAADAYPGCEATEFVDVVSGTSDRREEYDRLREQIASGDIETVVVDEISRLSRLGSGEIPQFIQHCLDHETSVDDLEVGLSVDVDDTAFSQAVNEMIVGLLGSLAKIEHKQKMRRIRSGIEAAQSAGTWTGRPPRGFTVEDGQLRVEPEEFLRVRAAVERVSAGEPVATVAEDAGLPSSTLSRLSSDRSELYLQGEADDDRVASAVKEVTPLPEPEAAPGDWRGEVREIVREEMK